MGGWIYGCRFLMDMNLALPDPTSVFQQQKIKVSAHFAHYIREGFIGQNTTKQKLLANAGSSD